MFLKKFEEEQFCEKYPPELIEHEPCDGEGETGRRRRERRGSARTGGPQYSSTRSCVIMFRQNISPCYPPVNTTTRSPGRAEQTGGQRPGAGEQAVGSHPKDPDGNYVV